jgi:hypothetical protein
MANDVSNTDMTVSILLGMEAGGAGMIPVARVERGPSDSFSLFERE